MFFFILLKCILNASVIECKRQTHSCWHTFSRGVWVGGGNLHYHQFEDETTGLAHLYTRFRKLEHYRLVDEPTLCEHSVLEGRRLQQCRADETTVRVNWMLDTRSEHNIVCGVIRSSFLVPVIYFFFCHPSQVVASMTQSPENVRNPVRLKVYNGSKISKSWQSSTAVYSAWT